MAGRTGKNAWQQTSCDAEHLAQEAIDRADYKIAKDARWVPDVQKCVRTAAEIASAMAFLHSKDILHSDLSSSNVLLSKQAVPGTQDDRTVAKVGATGTFSGLTMVRCRASGCGE